ncbi:MAG: NAD(P)H-dependent oxidoreductase [Deltaproteobacteria bacterium]|nr:NAD(P)H-dependent oxidoreductase [Deltaproteobacteria bacterium]
MQVLVVVGSMRERSTTRHALAIAAQGAFEAGARVDWADLKDLALPFCDGRTDRDAYGPAVTRWRERIRSTDAFLVGSPEYWGSMTGSLKNAIDLLEAEAFHGKMVGLLAVARGDAGAMNTLNQLRHVFRWMGAWVLPTQVSIPRAREAFDEEGRAVRPGLEEELLGLGREVVRYARLLAGNGHAPAGTRGEGVPPGPGPK